MRFDAGYIRPDPGESAYAALDRGDGTQVLKLLDAYLASWSRLPVVIALRTAYETYAMNLLTQAQYIHLTDSHSGLAEFRETGSLDFEVTLRRSAGRPFRMQNRTRGHGAAGAGSNNPLINCVLMHRGQSEVLRVNGSTEQMVWPARGCPLLAGTTEAKVDSVPGSGQEAFRGRSPAPKYTL